METEREAHAPSTPPSPGPAPERVFLETLRQAGLLSDLTDAVAQALLARPLSEEPDARRLDLITAYYAAVDAGENGAGTARVQHDRFFLHDGSGDESAPEIVQRLAALLPELDALHLERIGSADGPLVIRMGDHFAAVTDIEEPELDTGEIDLSELDEHSVTVRGLVVAVNVLLGQRDVRSRFVPLAGDGAREAFVCVGLQEATALMRAGCLEFDQPETVLEFGAW